MSSADYWKKREQEAKRDTIRDEEEYRKRIETIYKQTYEAVERQINDWYARYASKNGLSMPEARMRVKKLDMERYERLAAKYVATHDFSDQANEEMEIYNLTMRINRLELLKAQINLELLAGYDDLDKELEREFIEQAMKEDRRLAGILGDSVIGNQKYAKQIVNASFWNATYSERIWGNNMPRLRSSIETQLRNGIIQGIHPTELARKLRQSFDVSVRDSERLMITEVRRIQTEIQKDSFDRNGFKEYRFISAGDGRVCPECERLHGQHFKISEMQPGENAPPMHPVCRCSAAAWMDGEKYKRWLDALERGEDVRWKDFDEWDNSHSRKMGSGKKELKEHIDWQEPSGNKISNEDFKRIRKYANDRGIAIAGVKGSYLDLELVQDAIDKVDEVLNKYGMRERFDRTFTMDFSHSLKSTDFATSYPGTNYIVYFNKDAYRNREVLQAEYKELEKNKFFVRGTDYKSIPYHEMGHIIADVFNINPLEVALRLTGAENEKVLREELKSKLSEYASKIGGDEIIAECYSAVLSGIDNEFALKFVKECDKIILEKR